MEEKGYLRVKVTAARGNFPLEGAKVRIYSTEQNTLSLLSTLTTDSSGRTRLIELSAPPFSASQSPDSGIIPYTFYTIETDYDGYYSVQNIMAPIYSGVTSVQNVAMVPKGITRPNEDTRFNLSAVPDL